MLKREKLFPILQKEWLSNETVKLRLWEKQQAEFSMQCIIKQQFIATGCCGSQEYKFVNKAIRQAHRWEFQQWLLKMKMPILFRPKKSLFHICPVLVFWTQDTINVWHQTWDTGVDGLLVWPNITFFIVLTVIQLRYRRWDDQDDLWDEHQKWN